MWYPEAIDLHETMADAAIVMIEEATEASVPIWDLREQFLEVFDVAAEQMELN